MKLVPVELIFAYHGVITLLCVCTNILLHFGRIPYQLL